MKTSKKVILFSSIFATIGLIGTTSVLLSSCGETTSVDTPDKPNTPDTPNITNVPSNPGNNSGGTITPDDNVNNGNNGNQNNNGSTTTPDNNGSNGNGNSQSPSLPSTPTIELTKKEATPEDLDLISSMDSIKEDFSNFDKKQTWSLYNTDSNVLAGQNVPIVNSNDTLKLRAQMLYTQCENSNSYFSNNLNSFDTGIKLLTFNKDYNNNDALSKFNSALSDAVNSVWATNGDYMPRPYKQMFGGATFKVPWITEDTIIINKMIFSPRHFDGFGVARGALSNKFEIVT